MLLEWNDRWRCLTDYDRLCKSVNLWNSHAGLAPEASNIPNEIQVLNWGLIWSFPLFIRRTDYWNYYWNQICKNKLINPLVRGTLDFVLVQSSLPPRKAEDLIGLFMTAWHLCLRVGGFQNPGVCLQAFPSFLPLHSSPCNSLLPNCTETLATQAMTECSSIINTNPKQLLIVGIFWNNVNGKTFDVSSEWNLLFKNSSGAVWRRLNS